MIEHMLIDGEWRPGRGPIQRSVDPATGAVIWQGPSASVDDVDDAVRAAHDAAPAWSRLSLSERLAVMELFCERLKMAGDDMANLISRENGKPLWEARQEVGAMLNKLAISVQAFHERCGDVRSELSVGASVRRAHAHGVVAVMGPFNLPGHLPNGHIIPALLAGNTVVFKPSEQTPAVGEKMAELWAAAGLPPGVLNLVHGGKDAGEALVQHPGLNGLFFTGSYAVGRQIHAAFGGYPEKILALEMGGNNPLVVANVTDTRVAAYTTVLSAFITSGQRCVCARRLIVLEGDNGDAFLERLVRMTAHIKVDAATTRPEPFMGPLINESAAMVVMAAQEQLRQAGATALYECQQQGAFVTPGIWDSTSVVNRPDCEIFGPLLQVIRVPDVMAALTEANRTAYGLAAGLLSDSAADYGVFRAGIRAGIVNWNRQLTGASSSAPFGGVGRSGNFRPSAYFAADYCSYPVSSIECVDLTMPETVAPGVVVD